MEATARARFVRIGPRKVRIIRDLIIGKEAGHAVQVLRNTSKRGAQVLLKVVCSALANGKRMSDDELRWEVRKVTVDDGPRLKRSRSAPMGRAMRVLKRMSHIAVTLESANTQGTK